MTMEDKSLSDEQFDAFLRGATRGDLAAEGAWILAAMEEVQEAVQSVDWARARQTLERYRDSWGTVANTAAMTEIVFLLRAIDVLVETSAQLEAIAIQQQGN